MRIWLAILALASGLAFAGVAPGPVFGSGGAITTSSGGATLVFNYPNFQTHTGIALNNSATFGSSSPYPMILNNGQHSAAGGWYTTQQNITAFTTDFTFQLNATGIAIGFVVQNSTSADMQPCSSQYTSDWGDGVSADANGGGYAAYFQSPQVNQCPLADSVGIEFDVSGQNGNSYLDANPSTVTLNAEGGPFMGTVAGTPTVPINGGFMPSMDLEQYGINMGSNDTMDAHVVYDGSVLTMVLKDTVTGSQARFAWPVHIPTFMPGDLAYVGFVGGTYNPVVQQVDSWEFWSGYNTRLPTPALSPAGGQYSTSQTVSIACPSGATCYYTTNGKLPTTSDTVYSTPLTVSASEFVQAVAVETNYTDSYVAQGNYVISGGGNTIDFPSGFSGTGLIRYNGTAALSGTAIQLTDTVNGHETGSAWYDAPINVSGNWSTTFTLNFTSANADGMCFAIQNSVPVSSEVAGNIYTSGTTFALGGGPDAVGLSAGGFGYFGFTNGMCLMFDLWNGGAGANLTGLVTGNTEPEGSSGSISLSPVTLGSNNPLTVTVTYSSSAHTLTEQVVDSASNTFTHTYSSVDIPTILGQNDAFVGFTGGTGGSTAVQQVTTWTGF